MNKTALTQTKRFPILSIEETGDSISFSTIIRKLNEADGKFYCFSFGARYKGVTERAKREHMGRFYRDCYLQTVMARVDLSAVDATRKPVWVLDADQDSEEIRIKKALQQFPTGKVVIPEKKVPEMKVSAGGHLYEE